MIKMSVTKKEESTNQKTFFPSCELEAVDEFEFDDYERINLSELGNDDEIEGKPYLSEVGSYTVDDDGVKKTIHSAHLYIVDDDAKEYYDIKINLKENSDLQKNVHKSSTLFAFATGILELEHPGCTSGMNRIKKVDLSEFRSFTNELNKMIVKVKTIKSKGKKSFVYNTFKVLKVES